MPDKLYIQPLTLVPSPQAVAGDAIRLAGGMAYAHLIAVTVMRGGDVVMRELVTASGIDWVFERLPDELGPEAEAQWAGLTAAHPPLQLGTRTIRLDQPQVMGILNATTKPGDIVLDPFFGTGTTGAVAKRLGRQWIGCEREETYRRVALKRIDKELPLDESALATMQSRKDAPRVAFGQLVEAGLLAPGTELFDKQRRWTAAVRADGSVVSGSEVGSIHGVGKALQGAPSCNGWTFWHLEHEGHVRPIDTLRQLYLLAIED